jgi:hypothetical protein
MLRPFSALVAASWVCLAFSSAAEPTDDELRKKPITTDAGEVGKLLLRWHAQGTAAGNVGDWYDNRDREHSPLDLRPWPQLRKVAYTPEELKLRRDWAMATVTRPQATFGNSSTSAPPEQGGSNVRTYYAHPRGLSFLHHHYTHNNLYIYPEHRDHDPGHNGVGDGYGDLYPTNTPYLITSQGSSGSDQPFMRAVPFTFAAFRPAVKKKLVESGLLMPTLQMILRRTNKHLAGPGEYLTGKAHPTVFEGGGVDPAAMVKLAHDIRPDNIPPLVKLAVLEETRTTAGQDFFEPVGLREQHADTACVIARLWRGRERRRRLVVSAAGSIDLNKKPLTFTWVLLRGDPKRVRITPLDKTGSKAEVVVDYHERRPIAPASAMESNRVDVGVFASNGAYHSAPAFVTFYSFDCEARTYDDKGRVVEIGYGMGETEIRVTDAAGLFAALAGRGLAAKFFTPSDAQRADLLRCAADAGVLQQAVAKAVGRRRACEADRDRARGGPPEALRKAEAEVQAAGKAVAAAEEALRKFLDGPRPALKASPRAFAVSLLRQTARDPLLWNAHAAVLVRQYDQPAAGPRRGRVDAARRELLGLGLAKDGPGKTLVFQAAGPGLTVFDRALRERFHAAVLAELVVPGAVEVVWRTNFVDQRLTAPKRWRDAYHYDGDRLRGWTRYQDGKVSEYTADGLLVLKTDERGRAVEARTVVYRQAPPAGRVWVNANPLAPEPGGEVVTFAYEGQARKETGRRKP